jgi:hypothetical protein
MTEMRAGSGGSQTVYFFQMIKAVQALGLGMFGGV